MLNRLTVPARILLCSLLAITSFAAVPSHAQYSVAETWHIGGTGGWDYLALDSAARRLYITHGQQVDVVDLRDGKVVGAITGPKGTHGVALDAAGHFGYISDGGAGQVVVFDRKSLATVATVAAGKNPDGILYEPRTKTVWAFNGRSNSVTIIDTATRQVVATTPLPGKPEFPQADGKGDVFVNIESENSISRLDAHTHAITATWKLDGCDSPSGLAIDRTHHRLFSVCDGNKMVVTDAISGKQLGSATIGSGPDAARYSGKRRLVFSSNGDGTLTVIDAAHGYSVLQNVTTAKGARTMAYDDNTDRAYLATADFGRRPDPMPDNPHPRPAIVPDSFRILVVRRK
jgi:YVTN family beta-propeller protein